MQEEADAECGHIEGVHCKNLFVKDKAGQLFLLCCPGERVIRLGRLVRRLGAKKKLSFASEARLMEVLGVIKGSVTPFGVVNDTAHACHVVLDAALEGQEQLCFHPLQNGATTVLSMAGLQRFLTAQGAPFSVVDLEAKE
jgi:Ala-tRNA(Pro) deacylase